MLEILKNEIDWVSVAFIFFLILCVFFFTACGTREKKVYMQITQDEAVKMMEEEKDYVILDVRTKEEYEAGHIPHAICIPNETIGTDEIEELPDKDQIILVYCRSGNRSKQASEKLLALGYTRIYEFGGIIDWKGQIVK